MTRTGKRFWAKAAVILAAIPVILWAYEYGPDVGYCSVPGENGNCAQSGCHVGTANTGSGNVSVSFPNGLTYTPGVAQQLTVTIADPAATQRAWGFQLTARPSSSSATQAGSFTSLNGQTQVLCSDSSLDPNREKVLAFGASQTCPGSQSLSYMEHTLAGYNASLGKSGSYSYSFNWTPPANSVGNVVLYLAGNAANGDLTTNGDHIYTKSYTLTPGTASNGPTISSVVGNATSQPVIAPNTYVNILGSNLSTQTDLWTVNGTTLPTTTDSVSVTVGGKAAYVEYVSPTQVQILTPPDLGFGQVAVQLTNSNGTSSSVTVTSQQFAPAFFQWVNNQPVTTHADNSDAMKNGSYAGLTTVPAKPGEYVVFWGTGFGPTTPATPKGTLVPSGSTIYYVSTVPTLTINNQPMTYYATALSPSFAGLYQVVAQVPANMPNGDWPVVATVGGVSSPSGVLLTVHN